MRKFLILVLVAGLFTSCEVNTQDWRAKHVKTGNIVVIDDLERGFKAGDTIAGSHGNRIVLLELVSK